ncbi:ROK family protein [Arthrobacter pascens]|uniref:ROK family protein n=1 Tax=Arthrobacter pascens TaxID=1677 RepID=UPI0027D8F6B5|nr:ROK family protein [Arthrobacter pascens]
MGAGLIDRGTLLRGMKGTAGAIGHIPIPRGIDFPCICGNKGCLVALVSQQVHATDLPIHRLSRQRCHCYRKDSRLG